MKVTKLNTLSNGEVSFEIKTNEIGWAAFIRVIKNVPGIQADEIRHNPMNDDASARVILNGREIQVYTPFSDYFVTCACDCEEIQAVVAKLEEHKVRWWEHLL